MMVNEDGLNRTDGGAILRHHLAFVPASMTV